MSSVLVINRLVLLGLLAVPLYSQPVVDVFTAGEPNSDGFHVNSYRIPGFIATNGTLIVLAEARLYSCGDKTPHDLVAKRSTDNGNTWGPMMTVVNPAKVWGSHEGGVHGGAVYDPTPVALNNGTVRVIFSYCPSRYMTRPPIPQAFELWEVITHDLGLTWSAPRNLSDILPPLREGEPDWIMRTGGGGGNGITVQNGQYAGRLIVPGYHAYPLTKLANGFLDASSKVDTNCTPAQGLAVADAWCNKPGVCIATPGPLIALKSGSKSYPTSSEWRCYSPSCLTSDHKQYNRTSGCIEYCTYTEEIADIVDTCTIPPPPPPPSPYQTSWSHVLISDDHGATWTLSESFFPGTGEGSLAEIFNPPASGQLIYIARRVTGTDCVDPNIPHCAGSMTSSDGGKTWKTARDIGQLPDPTCKNTVASFKSSADHPGTLIHSGSHSFVRRTNVSALFSHDGGVTWGNETMVWQDPKIGGYSTVQTWDNHIGLVFENNTCNIVFAPVIEGVN